ncbi:hypothetical protein RF11_09119 [Thelohanellus kitauei]|uniref:Uncharacterized protein n=1 Tax=Thelohanellus kitauei TaxID=669202 RepID=A0A0C2N195_THEKT|nr:hypothetical protein RF11_09119 [Thelohanellus kitauei]
MILVLKCRNVIDEAVISTVAISVIFKEFLTKLVKILEGKDNSRSDPDFYDTYPYKIHFLPIYGQFLTPCDKCFSQLRSVVRRDGTLQGTNDDIPRVMEACERVTQENLVNDINHCEQFFQQCLN